MARNQTPTLFTTLPVDPGSLTPLHRQLYDRLREAILRGNLTAGARLPSTRSLAGGLRVSRNTVIEAFDQLLAEGYLETRVGSGTYVSRSLPEHLVQAASASRRARSRVAKKHSVSKRGALLAAMPTMLFHGEDHARAFQPGLPALDAFPCTIWRKLVMRRWRRWPESLVGYGAAAGYLPLREAIASYLGTARGVQCTPEQVIVVAGGHQGLDLASRLLLDPGDAAWIEEPGYTGARAALLAAGARLVPVRVDGDGLDVAAGQTQCADARLVFVSPSHQYPLGVTMSVSRRLALLDWASRAGAWVLEDDYDSEFRYVGRPLPALQGLDRQQRVIYLGSFSHVVFPSLRMGYIVVPPELVQPFVAARTVLDRHAVWLDQAVLADFLNEGYFARHIRRMRVLYAQRQEVLVRAMRQELAGLLEVAPAEAGLNLVGWLHQDIDDQAAVKQAAKYGVVTRPLSSFYVRQPKRGGLQLGYAALDARQIRDGVRRLAFALRETASGHSSRRVSKRAK